MGLQHTLGHVECPACEESKQSTHMYSAQFASHKFPLAATLWLNTRRNIGKVTHKHYLDYIHSLGSFFGLMRLDEIHVGHVMTYQRSRQEAIRASKQHKASRHNPHPARLNSDGASRINHELSCLGQIMKRAGLWTEIAKFYEPLPLPTESAGIALTPEEEEHFFEIAQSSPRWLVAYCCDVISRATTASPNEIRHLRLGDINLDTANGSYLQIEEGVKNDFRKRPVPLNRDAEWAIRQLLERAKGLGAEEPCHYLLPHRAHVKGAKADPTRPMDSWKKAHYAMCKKAGEKYPRLLRLRRYDLRHTACTTMLEDPTVSFTTIEHMMGHRISSKTKRKYDHVRNEALRQAASILQRKCKAPDGNSSEIRPKPPQNVVPFRSRASSGSSGD